MKKTRDRGVFTYGYLDIKPWLVEAWSNGLSGPPSRQHPKKTLPKKYPKKCLKIDDLGAVPPILKRTARACTAVTGKSRTLSAHHTTHVHAQL